MKTILLLICALPFFTTTGCIIAEGGRHGHEHGEYHGHSEVIVGPPIIVVPAVRVRD